MERKEEEEENGDDVGEENNRQTISGQKGRKEATGQRLLEYAMRHVCHASHTPTDFDILVKGLVNFVSTDAEKTGAFHT